MTDRLPDAWPCISLREPWLTCVLDFNKRIENRRWWASRRGPIWLHRSRTYSGVYVRDAIQWMKDRGLPFDVHREYSSLPAPGVVGYTEIDGVLPPTTGLLVNEFEATSEVAAFRANVPDADEILRWKFADQYGFVLKNTRAIDFVACPGRQRWFYLPADVEQRARGALAA